jgi:hypothetical protein
MSLLATTLDALSRHGFRSAVIGAAAMATHGVARATMDIDLLLVGREALESAAWEELREKGIDVDVRRGTPDDPLVGVVRLRSADASPLDVVIGASAWQRRIIERANPVRMLDCVVPVASAADLILLKLYAGAPQDRWDIVRLLSASPDSSLAESVESELSSLPRACRDLWEAIRRETR